jgi:hypothetical protein
VSDIDNVNDVRDMYILTDYCRLQWQRLTNDRPDFSSERAPQKDKTVTLRKKKKIFGQKSQIGLDTKTY